MKSYITKKSCLESTSGCVINIWKRILYTSLKDKLYSFTLVFSNVYSEIYIWIHITVTGSV